MNHGCTVITISRKESARTHTHTYTPLCRRRFSVGVFYVLLMELKATNVSYIHICITTAATAATPWKTTFTIYFHFTFLYTSSLCFLYFFFLFFFYYLLIRFIVDSCIFRVFFFFLLLLWMLGFDLLKQRKKAHQMKFRVQQIYCCEFLYCLIVRWCNDYESSNTVSSFPASLTSLFLFFRIYVSLINAHCIRYTCRYSSIVGYTLHN